MQRLTGFPVDAVVDNGPQPPGWEVKREAIPPVADEEGTNARFSPLPRRQAPKLSAHDEANIRDELRRIRNRVDFVASSKRDDFVDGPDSYDIASMVIIRLASLTERSEFTPWSQALSSDEIAAIRTIRNIAEHAGYAVMNDDLF